MSNEVFRFLEGERILLIIGMPGPDTDDCEVVADDGGETVKVRYQVYGKGPFFESNVKRDMLMWLRGSETSRRFAEWQARGV